MRFPFDLIRRQGNTTDLSIVPNSWIQEFQKKNEQALHLSLSIEPTVTSDQMTVKIKMALPNVHYPQIEFVSHLNSSTVMDLINNKPLNELRFSHLNMEVYSRFKNCFVDTKAIGCDTKCFTEITGGHFGWLRNGKYTL